MDDVKKELAISVKGLNKSFNLPHEKSNTIKGIFLNSFKKRSFEKQNVLKNISFEVKKGEFFGIVGRNGSGKSTLLKLLAGIYSPDSGSVNINGKLTPFIELGVGFNPELTGRENVFLNGALLGFNRSQMSEMYDEIVKFAELEKFMDQKLKNYSSGMQVRLAFSIAIQAESDVLLIDEVLAVGDANFQRKCFNIFKKIKQSDKTVIFISHDMGAVQEFCDRAMLIDGGTILANGKTSDIAANYNELNFTSADEINNKVENRYGNGDIRVKKLIPMVNGKQKKALKPNDEVTLEVTVISEINTNFLLGINIKNQDNTIVYSENTENMKTENKNISRGEKKVVSFKFNNQLGNGTYYISTALKNSDRTKLFDQVNDIVKLEVAGWTNSQPVIHIPTKKEIK